MLQRFIFFVSEISQCRIEDFAICAPNTQVDCNQLRPSWLTLMGFIAALSKIIQPVEKTGNVQLLLDDAIHFDNGTRVALLVFNHEGEHQLPETSPTECKAVRMHNLWSVRARETNKTSIKRG